MEQLPLYISIMFGATVLAIIIWSYFATRSGKFLWILLLWTLIQSTLGWTGVFQDTTTMPPRLMILGMLPALLMIAAVFLTRRGRNWMDRMDLKTITWLHTIRIPVEIVLAWLFYQGVMSVYITYHGTNFDLFSGLSAPVVAYLAFRKKATGKNILLSWNIVCLLLLLNVVVTAIFAFPSPFQQLAFDQPNRAVLYFPFCLLPTVVVPLVLFYHLVAIRRLTSAGAGRMAMSPPPGDTIS